MPPTQFASPTVSSLGSARSEPDRGGDAGETRLDPVIDARTRKPLDDAWIGGQPGKRAARAVDAQDPLANQRPLQPQLACQIVAGREVSEQLEQKMPVAD